MCSRAFRGSRFCHSSSPPFVSIEKPSLRRRFDQWLGNGVADRASYGLDQLSYAVPHHVVRPGRASDTLRKESNELRAVGGEDVNWDLPVKEPLAEADAVPPEKRRGGGDEFADEGDDVRPCLLYTSPSPRD